MSTLLAILIALAITYTAILIALIVLKPDDVGITAAMRVLPDTIALVSRLARDHDLPLTTRGRGINRPPSTPERRTSNRLQRRDGAAKGLSKRDVMRCLERIVVREVHNAT